MEAFTAALNKARAAHAKFIVTRHPLMTVEEQDDGVLAVVGPLIAMARPKSQLRRLDWMHVAAALSRDIITEEWMT